MAFCDDVSACIQMVTRSRLTFAMLEDTVTCVVLYSVEMTVVVVGCELEDDDAV